MLHHVLCLTETSFALVLDVDLSVLCIQVVCRTTGTEAEFAPQRLTWVCTSIQISPRSRSSSLLFKVVYVHVAPKLGIVMLHTCNICVSRPCFNSTMSCFRSTFLKICIVWLHLVQFHIAWKICLPLTMYHAGFSLACGGTNWETISMEGINDCDI